MKVTSQSLRSILLLLFHLFHLSPAERRLKFVVLLYRHGDRSPLEAYPTDPHKEDAWPQGFEQLSQIGMQQHYELGKFLRIRYSGFLNDTYNRHEVYVQSTDYDRTLMSAQANLAGLFPPVDKEIWNPNLKWQPIPVHTTPVSQDQLLLPFQNCPRVKELLKDTLASKEFQNLLQPYQDVLKNVSHETGYSVTELTSGKLWLVYDTLLCEDKHNFTLPNWVTPDIKAKLQKLSEFFLLALFGLSNQLEKSKLQGGVIMKSILKNITDATIPSNLRKMIIYSAHDTTIGGLQMALDVSNGQLPPYAACHFFELHQEENGQYSIEMFYRNDSSEKPYVLTLPGCASPCPLQKFTELISPIIVEDWAKECGIINNSEGVIKGLAVTVGFLGLAVIILLSLLCYFVIQTRRTYQNI
ncbi:prostatic acid phosphatase isoform X2 [Microcaecilia unicolor]|uniref:acid phosphatase n=1 Tax=Microcaecilia unicolor TaxID=1415580 RepID=A0A6P7Y4B2_9AMPH|nr:prostatic acid phosphatase isoform X2 [Microcaecilia unicolor]